jgi:hypothetical protein
LKNSIAPLCWYGFGGVKDLLELPVTLLNRLLMAMEDDGMMETFRSFQDPFYKAKKGV